MASLMMDKLQNLLGREVAIATMDGTALKGILENFDEETIVLQDVIELFKTELKWDTPVVSPHGGAGGKADSTSVDAYGIIDTSKLRSSLKRVYIRYIYVVHVWPWEMADSRGDIDQYTLL